MRFTTQRKTGVNESCFSRLWALKSLLLICCFDAEPIFFAAKFNSRLQSGRYYAPISFVRILLWPWLQFEEHRPHFVEYSGTENNYRL